jgi:RimJ/RimL family protein N-acetyltransferase
MIEDADFIVSLRTDPERSKHISKTSSQISSQEEFISSYFGSKTDFYFLICDWNQQRLGTVRIYDIQADSFCWGSWIISKDAPPNTAIESALLIYDFAFYSLHYSKSHFDVRKENERVVDFHKRFGAYAVTTDAINYYFEFTKDAYEAARQKYRRYLP